MARTAKRAALIRSWLETIACNIREDAAEHCAPHEILTGGRSQSL